MKKYQIIYVDSKGNPSMIEISNCESVRDAIRSFRFIFKTVEMIFMKELK